MTTLSRQLSPGDVILREEPFVHILDPQNKKLFCENCYKNGKHEVLKRCSGCRFFHYCSRACQTADWKSFHRLECAIYRKEMQKSGIIGEKESALLLCHPIQLVLRTYLMLKANPKIRIKHYTSADGKQCESFDKLMDHAKEFDEQMNPVEQEKRLVMEKTLSDLIKDVDWDLVTEIRNKICINGMSIDDQLLHSIGSGLYIAASVYDHSCRPNACRTFTGNILTIRATEKIPAGSTIYICYDDPAKILRERKEFLNSHFFFDCTCDRCVNQTKKEDEEMTLFLLENRAEYRKLLNSKVPPGPQYLNQILGKLPKLRSYYGSHHACLTVDLTNMAMAGLTLYGDDKEAYHNLMRILRREIEITHGTDGELYDSFASYFDMLTRMDCLKLRE